MGRGAAGVHAEAPAAVAAPAADRARGDRQHGRLPQLRRWPRPPPAPPCASTAATSTPSCPDQAPTSLASRSRYAANRTRSRAPQSRVSSREPRALPLVGCGEEPVAGGSELERVAARIRLGPPAPQVPGIDGGRGHAARAGVVESELLGELADRDPRRTALQRGDRVDDEDVLRRRCVALDADGGDAARPSSRPEPHEPEQGGPSLVAHAAHRTERVRLAPEISGRRVAHAIDARHHRRLSGCRSQSCSRRTTPCCGTGSPG